MGRYSREIFELIMLPMIRRGEVNARHLPGDGRMDYRMINKRAA